jgi:hypothetical protein
MKWREGLQALSMAAGVLAVIHSELAAHDPNAAPITWNREVSRIVFERCASCHRKGGTSFSLMTYQDAQPHASAIKDAVLSRRMPPWGAVKGFGTFRNDRGLTQDQIALITDWVEGGIVRGNNPNTLPPPPKFPRERPFTIPATAIAITTDRTLDRDVVVDGVYPQHVPSGVSMQIVAALPDGDVQPLVWLYEYRDEHRHPFLLRKRMSLPRGTLIRGVQRDARILLILAERTTPK